MKVLHHGAVEASVIVQLDRASHVPLHRQLYEGLRDAILANKLPGGTKLPSTRSLASEYGVSRNTVMYAFAQLMAEGYLEGKVGSGSYVRRLLPEELLTAESAESPMGDGTGLNSRRLSHRGVALVESGSVLDGSPATAYGGTSRPRAFRPGIPAVEDSVLKTWGQLGGRFWKRPPRDLLRDYANHAGYPPLREAISEYLGAARAVHCRPEQVIVVSGSQQALDLCARLLLDPGEEVWIEDPCYLGARAALEAGGGRLVPVRVDSEGLDVADGESKAPEARVACVTPSHQYPSGMTMSLRRRLALLRWASRAGAWVIEDDYDGEFRYRGRPLQALQGLDREGRVIYVGTFSKVLFPALRLGYMVLPGDLVDAFASAHRMCMRFSPTIEQAVLADFIAEGHFARHVRRMRALYSERRAILVEAVEKRLGGLLEVDAAEAGMHLVGWLPEGADAADVSREVLKRGVEAPPLSAFSLSEPQRPGLLLGYAAVPPHGIRFGVRRLAEAIEQHQSLCKQAP